MNALPQNISTSDFGPWTISPRVAHFLMHVLTPCMRTLEMGSGLSTHVFESAGCTHTALEHDRSHAPPCESVRICRLTGVPPWYQWRPTGAYDLVLVDGPPGNCGRSGVLRCARELHHRGTLWLVDDVNRLAEKHLADCLAERLGLTGRLAIDDADRRTAILWDARSAWDGVKLGRLCAG